MSSIIQLSGPAGIGLTAAAAAGSAARIAAIDAMIAGGVRGLAFPTYGSEDRYYERTAYTASIQDALFPHIFYDVPTPANAATADNTGTLPALAWDGLGTPNGARSSEAAQVEGYDGSENSDMWMVLCATPGDQAATVGVMFTVLPTNGYGTSIFRSANSNAIQVSVDSSSTLPLFTETDTGNPHIYSWRYEKATGYMRTYRDGVQQGNYNIPGVYPSAEMLTGPLGIGGVGADGSALVFANANGRFHVGAAGNGVLTNDQHAAIIDWLKEVYGI